ncbi:MAG: glycosyltransferase [Bacteroidales bacterium]|nr:MAG: glycosyltransferase [Bacteroidales bacterium]
MFGWEFPPHISGGLGTACYGLTKGLSNFKDIETHFVIPKAYGDEDQTGVSILNAGDVAISDREVNYKGFFKKINFIEVESNIIPYTSPEEYDRLVADYKSSKKKFIRTTFSGKLNFSGGYGSNLFQEIANYAVVASVIGMNYDFDVIHAHDWLTFPAGAAAKRVSGKPLVIHVHATDFDRSGGDVNPVVYQIEKNGMEAADKIIAVSNLTRNTIIEKYNINPDKVITVYNAVEPLSEKYFNLSKNYSDKIVSFLGRITMQKGPEYFIEAAYEVLKRRKDVRFVMGGSGELLNRMIARVAALRIGDKFHFTGFLKGDNVYQLYELSDVYVMPSVSEPFGISPLEALQSNVPVIISRQSGVSEILKHAIKIDFWDIHAMADAIYGILSYEGLHRMFSKYGREEVDNLKWENTAFKVKQIYESLV